MRTGAIDSRVAGALLVALGAYALWEGWRLYGLREALVAGAVVGDDTFPLLVGAGLLALGLFLLVVAPAPMGRVEMPRGEALVRMLVGAAGLVAYWLLAPLLGYTASTALVALVLYRGMGGYGWPAAALLSALTTGALYLLFRVWLLQPLPSGLLGG